ncbi:MAG TPA: ATP-binding protein [Candidatus Limnocylindria bacterium]|nr:ATP-binding protein [Candidatus Limnocylindria bacterium]
MRRRLHISFRFKILITFLLLVTVAVSVITFTMAKMFHADKTAYVSDLVSVVAVHAAEQADAALEASRERLLVLGRLIDDPNVPAERRTVMMEEMFAGMRGFVAVQVIEGGQETALLLERETLARAQLDPEIFRATLARGAGTLATRVSDAGSVINSTQSPELPTVTVAVNCPRSAGSPSLVVAGVLDVGQVLALGRSSRAFEVFLTDASGRLVVHPDARRVVAGERLSSVPKLPPGSQAEVREYTSGGTEMIGGFARVRIGDLRAGAQIPKSAAYFASRRLLTNLVLVALGLLLIAAVASILWSARVTRSLAHLDDAARAIGRGLFNVHVAVRSRDEMGQLAESFNQMANELNARDQALKQAQGQLIHSEKMAAFGQLGAGIAHEIKNPLAGIQGIVQLTARSLPADDALLVPLRTIEKETKRCRGIVDSLLKFARQEKLQLEPTALADVVRDTDIIMRHEMNLRGVTLNTSVPADLPQVQGSANQLQQVLMNLLLNAEQAMEARGEGKVEVTAIASPDGFVELRVADDGPGMPQHVQARIFEPFFTTKPTGKGTGLGLSVTFGIVRDHGGTIRVESTEGRGTTFFLRLPVAKQTSAPASSSGPAAAPEARAA